MIANRRFRDSWTEVKESSFRVLSHNADDILHVTDAQEIARCYIKNVKMFNYNAFSLKFANKANAYLNINTVVHVRK